MRNNKSRHWHLPVFNDGQSYSQPTLILLDISQGLANAYAFTRLPLPDKLDFTQIPADVQLMLKHLSQCIIHTDQIKKRTDQDPTLCHVQRILEMGHIVLKTSELKPYVQCYTELSVLQGCLLRGSGIVIPPQGRKTILSQLHDTHPGITRMKHLAKAYVWWPDLDKRLRIS